MPEEIATPLEGGLASEARVGPKPVVEVLPLVQLLLQVAAGEVDRGPELGSVRLLGSLNLAIEVGRPRADWSKLDSLMLQGLLEGEGEELAAAVGLDPLDRKRKLLENAFLKKSNGVRCGLPLVEAQHTHPRAIIDSSELNPS